MCDGRNFKHIMNSSEKVFYGRNTQFPWQVFKLIEQQSELSGQHIHHTLCGHGGERHMVIDKKEIFVDGHDSETSTVYQFYGCKWHGCPCLGFNNTYQKTLNLENRIRNSGYNVISVWNHENPRVSRRHFQRKFTPYSHFIFYDLETVLKKRNLVQTLDLMIYCSHIPVGVTIYDSLTKEPTFIDNNDPEALIKSICERACQQARDYFKRGLEGVSSDI